MKERNSGLIIENLLNKVKQNRKYKTISEDIVLTEINKYLKSNQINHFSKNQEKLAIKEIRKRLHRLYSSYQTKKKNKRESYLEDLKKVKSKKELLELTKKFLSIAISTKERINDYESIYEKIFSITKTPKVITDLGAGLNPLSFPLMDLEDESLAYYSYDIDLNDANFLNDYFKILKENLKINITGKAEILDVSNPDNIRKLKSSNIIFMFKLIDLIDNKNKKTKKISEDIIKTIFKLKKADFIVASFAKRTLSGKSMNIPIRRGFELMLERNNLAFFSFSTDNEIFYIMSINLKPYSLE